MRYPIGALTFYTDVWGTVTTSTYDATALALAERVHAACPYSNATRGTIDVQLRVI